MELAEKMNKKTIRKVIIIIAVLVAAIAVVFSTVFLLAKQKKIFINTWFVNEQKKPSHSLFACKCGISAGIIYRIS